MNNNKEIKVVMENELQINSINTQLGNGKKVVEQLIQGIDLSSCIDQNCCLRLKKLIIMLKNEYNFPFQNKQIYFYLEEVELFMNCGIDPISEDLKIRPQDYERNRMIVIKGKDLGISMVHRLMSFENNSTANQQKEKSDGEDNQQKSKCRRTKQRRIGHIIDKVIQWRKFYSGTINQKNQQVKFSLEDAAKEVKISKKSLDDYLFQIRFGHRYNFNFNEHYNDKVGVLRDFVRQKKKNDKTDIKNRKNHTKAQQKNHQDYQ